MLSILEFAAMAFSAAANPQQEAISRPLLMQVDDNGSATVVRLIGLTNDDACTVSYDLEVTQDGNRSVQRGVAQLRKGVLATVATVRLASRPLNARLIAKPCGAAEYQELFGPRVHGGPNSNTR